MTADLLSKADLTVYHAANTEVIDEVLRFDRKASSVTARLRNPATGAVAVEVIPLSQVCLSVGGVLIDDHRRDEQLAERAERVIG